MNVPIGTLITIYTSKVIHLICIKFGMDNKSIQHNILHLKNDTKNTVLD